MCMFFLSLFCLYLSLCLCFLLSYAVNKDLYINTENNIFISASMPTIVTRPSQIGRITRRARPSVRPTVCLSVLYDIVYFIYCLGDTQRQLLLDPSPVCLVLCSPCGFHVEWFHVLLYPIKPSSFWSSSTSFSMHVSDVTLFPVAGARIRKFDLPADVTSAPSLLIFTKRLKLHLFRLSYPGQTRPASNNLTKTQAA